MTLQPAPSRVASPCVKVCVLDTRNVCVGCGRTIDEITQWSRMTEEQQRQVCDLAQRRREQAVKPA